MMRRTLLSAGLILSGLLTPMAANAYVSPEAMLDDGDFSTRFLDPPPASSREYARIAAQQRAAEVAAQQEAQQKLISKQQSSKSVVAQEEETTHAAAPDDTTDIGKLIKAIETLQGQKDETESVRDARILERVKTQQEQNRLQAQIQWLTQTQSLHSGAPLMSDTGPATIGAVLLLFGTVALVLGRVRKMEKR